MPSQRKCAVTRPVRARRRAGMSLIELLIVIAILLTLMALAIPILFRARANANEAAAVAGLRSISTAQATYMQTYQQGYAPTLLALGPAAGPPSAAAADLLDQLLVSGFKSGYNIIYTPVDADGNGRFEDFRVNANPAVLGQSGFKYFYTDATNVIRFSTVGPATAASSPIPPQ